MNLGEDSDKDGLPDVWEQWQLYQTGEFPDENGDWPIERINKDGDFDKDGHSNYSEYLAGTFAGDATGYFELKIKEKQAAVVWFEFYGREVSDFRNVDYEAIAMLNVSATQQN